MAAADLLEPVVLDHVVVGAAFACLVFRTDEYLSAVDLETGGGNGVGLRRVVDGELGFAFLDVFFVSALLDFDGGVRAAARFLDVDEGVGIDAVKVGADAVVVNADVPVGGSVLVVGEIDLLLDVAVDPYDHVLVLFYAPCVLVGPLVHFHEGQEAVAVTVGLSAHASFESVCKGAEIGFPFFLDGLVAGHDAGGLGEQIRHLAGVFSVQHDDDLNAVLEMLEKGVEIFYEEEAVVAGNARYLFVAAGRMVVEEGVAGLKLVGGGLDLVFYSVPGGVGVFQNHLVVAENVGRPSDEGRVGFAGRQFRKVFVFVLVHAYYQGSVFGVALELLRLAGDQKTADPFRGIPWEGHLKRFARLNVRVVVGAVKLAFKLDMHVKFVGEKRHSAKTQNKAQQFRIHVFSLLHT